MEETDESIVGVEEDEEDFRSYCEDEDVWKETEGVVKEEVNEFSVKMFFKGISLAEFGDSFFGFSGIGVVMEGSANSPVIQVQKKLDFYLDESVVDYLALMDGLTAAMQNKIRTVYAFADSLLLYDQIMYKKKLDNPLLLALRERILELAHNLEEFVLKLTPSINLLRPLQLAQVAIGVISSPAKGDKSLENCSICCEDKPTLMMINIKCSHKFCSHCMRTYLYGKLQSSLNGIYCPYRNCSILLDPRECLSARASSSTQSDNSCVECPVCRRFICVECGVPWHSSTSCEEYQNLPLEERDAADITLHLLAQNKRWKPCQQCTRMIELTQGCYHMTCCNRPVYQGLSLNGNLVGMLKKGVAGKWPFMLRWSLGTFNSLPMIMHAYSDQERSHRALIKRFLAGGFSLSDHHPSPLCTDSYVDTMKDLHQLPWFQ
ncbi:hypothetical protein ES288_D06G182400v1 [Gossypium darwinii]|uniref:RBR-type E3 ubiquitin transferase n=1 Tax=Gossypium darwinii TaxID=34276 RepID=A0A5D2C7Y5_GOSDA|nr:hypothetical protein ES288_D06G182400v1 [Gossypium darwinii]